MTRIKLCGLSRPCNIEAVNSATLAIKVLYSYAVDVSSGIETDGMKDYKKWRLLLLP